MRNGGDTGRRFQIVDLKGHEVNPFHCALFIDNVLIPILCGLKRKREVYKNESSGESWSNEC